MKSILLSFQPYWADKIMQGEKVYEYRKRFCDEPVIAYMYVSTPVKAVKGIIKLGKRVPLTDWANFYSDNREVSQRIADSMTRNKYVMQILSVQDTTSISLDKLRNDIKGFKAPQMYYDLDNNPVLKSYLESNLILKDDWFENDFSIDMINHICAHL